jgi:hypothetical protein
MNKEDQGLNFLVRPLLEGEEQDSIILLPLEEEMWKMRQC